MVINSDSSFPSVFPPRKIQHQVPRRQVIRMVLDLWDWPLTGEAIPWSAHWVPKTGWWGIHLPPPRYRPRQVASCQLPGYSMGSLPAKNSVCLDGECHTLWYFANDDSAKGFLWSYLHRVFRDWEFTFNTFSELLVMGAATNSIFNSLSMPNRGDDMTSPILGSLGSLNCSAGQVSSQENK